MEKYFVYRGEYNGYFIKVASITAIFNAHIHVNQISCIFPFKYLYLVCQKVHSKTLQEKSTNDIMKLHDTLHWTLYDGRTADAL